MIVVIPFVRWGSVDSPNARIRRHEEPAAPYDRAASVAFASLRRFNPSIGLVYVTNVPPPAALGELFDRLSVETRLVEFEHVPPVGFAETFRTSLYLVDVIRSGWSDDVLFLDPDVLCLRPLDDLAGLEPECVGVLPMPYGPDHKVNGVSVRESAALRRELGSVDPALVHFGGECYRVPRPDLERLATRLDEAWTWTLQRHRDGRLHFRTEEHLMMYALDDVATTSLARFVRRIWTGPSYSNVTGDEGNLSVWHLPAEKGVGFDRFLDGVSAPTSEFWLGSDEGFRHRAARVFGVRPMRRSRRLMRRLPTLRW